jgi:hypothetical protein
MSMPKRLCSRPCNLWLETVHLKKIFTAGILGVCQFNVPCKVSYVLLVSGGELVDCSMIQSYKFSSSSAVVIQLHIGV